MRNSLYFILAFLSFSSNAQIVNADFEKWNDTLVPGFPRLEGWDHVKRTGTVGGFFGTWRDTPGEHGKYGLMVSRWYYYDWDAVRQITPINYNPDWLTGFYRYTSTNLVGPNPQDTATVEVYLTLWNSTLNRRDTVGTGSQDLWLSTVYAPFICPIGYTMAGIADSFRILISPSKLKGPGGCRDSNYCSFLTVDSLNFEQNTISVHTPVIAPLFGSFTLYPNPVTNYVVMNNPMGADFSYSVVNNMGQVVASGIGQKPNTILPVQNFPAGIFSVVIKTAKGQDYSLRFLKY